MELFCLVLLIVQHTYIIHTYMNTYICTCTHTYVHVHIHHVCSIELSERSLFIIVYLHRQESPQLTCKKYKYRYEYRYEDNIIMTCT